MMQHGLMRIGWLASVMVATGGLALAQPTSSDQMVLEEIRSERAALNAEREALKLELALARDALANQQRGLREGASGGDRVAYGEVVEIGAHETIQSAVAFGSDIRVEGRVLGDATAFGGDVIVRPSGIIVGDAVSFGGRVLIEDGGQLAGEPISMVLPSPPTPGTTEAAGSLTGFLDLPTLAQTLYRRLVLMLSFAGAGVLVVGLFPQRVARVADTLEHQPIRSAVLGSAIASFVAMFSLLLAVVTLGLGLPVSFLLVAFLGLAWLLGFVGLCQAVGDRLPFAQKPHGRWAAFLVGVLLLTFISSLPLIGFLVVSAASLIGIGAASMSALGTR
jgi:hypothetical protein